MAITLFFVGVSYADLALLSTRRMKTGMAPGGLEEWKQNFPSFNKSWSLRLVRNLSFTTFDSLTEFFPDPHHFLPIGIFALHQWARKDSWPSIPLSVFTLVTILACVIYPALLTFRLGRRNDR